MEALNALFTNSRPSPGIWKIVSITNDPVRIPAMAGPRNETTGSNPPRREWRKITRASDAPFAHAVRIKSWLRISSMPPRVRRAMYAAYTQPSVRHGRTRSIGVYQPEAFNQPR